MRPTDYLDKISRTLIYDNLEEFPFSLFKKSCLIHSKGLYGIFLLEDENNNRYTVKVQSLIEKEIVINLYIREFASKIPNILLFEGVYAGNNPREYDLFKNLIKDSSCKDRKLSEIFTEKKYVYSLSKACSSNLTLYLKNNTINFNSFIVYSFSLLVGLQTLHRLGVVHNDFASRNILVCYINSPYKNIKYVYNDGKNKKSWIFPYNKEMKIIDFGESLITDNISNYCEVFKSDLNQLINIFNELWRRVEDKDALKEEKYNNLRKNIENCKNILQIMFNSDIYDSFIEEKEEDRHDKTFVVDLLHFPIK